jgi:hypothetical protein
LGFKRYSEEGAGVEPIIWIPACDWCLGRIAGSNGKIAGAQPAICEQCGELFLAARYGQKFCSARCRARSWRDGRLVG